MNGGIGGGVLGYDYQYNSKLVIGLVTDFLGSSASGSTSYTSSTFQCNGSCQTALNYFGTIRARVGYSLWNRFLPYVTAGVAYGDLYGKIGTPPAPNGDNMSKVEPGWVAGAGIEYAVWKRLSLSLEYQYLGFNSLYYDEKGHVCGNGSCTATNNTFDALRVGVNYHF